MYLKKCEMLGLSCLLAAGVACGASVVSESFEGAATGADVKTLTSATWDGYGAVEAGAIAGYESLAGRPIGGDSAKVLRVDGFVTCAPTTAMAANTPAQVDLMVQAVKPEEALPLPDGEAEANDIQIAVGTDMDDTLKVYCKNKSGETGWYTLTTVTAGNWYRVSFIFDYAAGRCQVRVDGQPCMTATGYLTATDNSEVAGAWYKLNHTTNTKLSSIKVVGSTALDDVVIKAGADEKLAMPADAAKDGVALAWYDDNGIAWVPGAKYDQSDLTVAQKYERGLSPFDGEKLQLKTMTMTGNTATFSIPKINPPTGKTAQLVYNTKPDFSGEGAAIPVTENTDTVTVDNLPNGNVYYYRLEVK